MTNPPPTTVAVVGGGVLGAATAQQLARSGVQVTLFTESEPADGASGRSLSWLNSGGIRSEAYHRLRVAGIDRYRTLFARRPDTRWLRFDGGLAWSADPDALRRQHDHERAHGYDSRLLSPTQVAEQVPGVDPAAVPATGALWYAGEGWVDLPSLVHHLVADLEAAGGRLVTHAGRCTVVVEDGAVTGVRTGTGDLDRVDAVVLATGAAVPSMAAELGLTVPDDTPLSLLVTTDPVDTALRVPLNTPRASIRPTPDGALAVDSDWTAVSITEDANGGATVPPAVIEELLAEASALLAGRPALTAARWAAGRKPIPGDGEPVLGAVDGIDGLSLAFSHSGATLGLIAGELLAEEIVTGRPHPMLDDFNVRRFG